MLVSVINVSPCVTLFLLLSAGSVVFSILLPLLALPSSIWILNFMRTFISFHSFSFDWKLISVNKFTTDKILKRFNRFYFLRFGTLILNCICISFSNVAINAGFLTKHSLIDKYSFLKAGMYVTNVLPTVVYAFGTHSKPQLHFNTPWGFLFFPGSIQMKQWLEMG